MTDTTESCSADLARTSRQRRRPVRRCAAARAAVSSPAASGSRRPAHAQGDLIAAIQAAQAGARDAPPPRAERRAEPPRHSRAGGHPRAPPADRRSAGPSGASTPATVASQHAVTSQQPTATDDASRASASRRRPAAAPRQQRRGATRGRADRSEDDAAGRRAQRRGPSAPPQTAGSEPPAATRPSARPQRQNDRQTATAAERARARASGQPATAQHERPARAAERPAATTGDRRSVPGRGRRAAAGATAVDAAATRTGRPAADGDRAAAGAQDRDRAARAASDRPGGSSRSDRNEPDLQVRGRRRLVPVRRHPRHPRQLRLRPHQRLPARPDDVYVSLSRCASYGLRRGDAVTGAVRQPREGERKEKFNALVRLDTVNGMDPEEARSRPEFTKLTPLYPQERLRLETEPNILTPGSSTWSCRSARASAA